MEISINWIAILLATVATFTSGALWYSVLFRNAWIKHAKIKMTDTEHGSPIIFLVPLATSFLVAVALYHITFVTHAFFGGSFLVAALQTGLWAWLSFSFATLAMNYIFQGRSKELLAIDTGNTLVMFVLSGLIIGLFGS